MNGAAGSGPAPRVRVVLLERDGTLVEDVLGTATPAASRPSPVLARPSPCADGEQPGQLALRPMARTR